MMSLLRIARPGPGRRRPSGKPRSVGFVPSSIQGLEHRTLMSLAIDVRYDFDTSHFFNTTEKRNLMQEAADTIASALTDSLLPIQESGGNTWSAVINSPSSGQQVAIPHLVVPADTIILYVGARTLGAGEKGQGGPGGFSWSGTQQWGQLVEGRGQPGATAAIPTDLGIWGGTITFDSGDTNWFFGQTTAGLSAGQTDFFSVALHEIGHVLGIGYISTAGLTPWSRFININTFTGPNSEAAFGGQPVPLAPGLAHWQAGVQSNGVEAAMTPTLLEGTRKVLTPLDYAALRDVGWQVDTQSRIKFDSTHYEVKENAGQVTITVIRPTGGDAASVQYTTGGGTAIPNSDYVPRTGVLNFASGEMAKTFTITIVNDDQSEPDKTVGLTLSNFNGAVPGNPAAAILTIQDDDRQAMIPDDFDGDGKTDVGVYQPTDSRFTLYTSSPANNILLQFGQGTLYGGHPVPVTGDFDGDGISDVGVYQPTDSRFTLYTSSPANNILLQFGQGTLYGGNPIPVTGDFDGDGIRRTSASISPPIRGLPSTRRVRRTTSSSSSAREPSTAVIRSPSPAISTGTGSPTSVSISRPIPDSPSTPPAPAITSPSSSARGRSGAATRSPSPATSTGMGSATSGSISRPIPDSPSIPPAPAITSPCSLARGRSGAATPSPSPATSTGMARRTSASISPPIPGLPSTPPAPAITSPSSLARERSGAATRFPFPSRPPPRPIGFPSPCKARACPMRSRWSRSLREPGRAIF